MAHEIQVLHQKEEIGHDKTPLPVLKAQLEEGRDHRMLFSQSFFVDGDVVVEVFLQSFLELFSGIAPELLGFWRGHSKVLDPGRGKVGKKLSTLIGGRLTVQATQCKKDCQQKRPERP
ncbi:hypothetical protein D3C87_1032740 [compost metagenome]